MADPHRNVPHVPDLAREGKAWVVAWSAAKKPTPVAYRLTPEGQELIYQTMREQAQHSLAHPETAPHRTVLTGKGDHA